MKKNKKVSKKRWRFCRSRCLQGEGINISPDIENRIDIHQAHFDGGCVRHSHMRVRHETFIGAINTAFKNRQLLYGIETQS